MRQSLSLSRHATAKLLRISLRTLQNWETGKARIPYAAYKLIRLFNSYEIFHPIWKDWRIVGSKLITPEGHSLEVGDFHWLSLMARRAEAFSKIYRQLREIQARAGGSVAPGAPSPELVLSKTTFQLAQHQQPKTPAKTENQALSITLWLGAGASQPLTQPQNPQTIPQPLPVFQPFMASGQQVFSQKAKGGRP